jgi:hypothetical protein
MDIDEPGRQRSAGRVYTVVGCVYLSQLHSAMNECSSYEPGWAVAERCDFSAV